MSRVIILLMFVTSLGVFACAEEPVLSYRGTPGKISYGKHIVFVSGDEEYRSEEMVVQFARILSERHGFDCTVLFAVNKETGCIDPDTPDNIPGLEALDKADLMVVFLRFRNLPDDQMRKIDEYLMSGRPVMGIRPSVVAFKIPGDRKYVRYSYTNGLRNEAWEGGFGRLVLGETWIDHHGKHGVQATRGVIAADQTSHPIVRGCSDIFGPSDVYAIRLPLQEGIVPLVYGQVLEGKNPTDKPVVGGKNDPMMPLAWTKPYRLPGGKEGRCFMSTMGASQDFACEDFRRLIVNATYWLVGLESQIPQQSDVSLVGDYQPSPFGFHGYRKGLTPQEIK